jgi:hypothetical protein
MTNVLSNPTLRYIVKWIVITVFAQYTMMAIRKLGSTLRRLKKSGPIIES